MWKLPKLFELTDAQRTNLQKDKVFQTLRLLGLVCYTFIMVFMVMDMLTGRIPGWGFVYFAHRLLWTTLVLIGQIAVAAVIEIIRYLIGKYESDV